MAAAVIAETIVGFPMDNAPANIGTGQGLIWGIYNATSTENSDWVVLAEFASIEFVICYAISTGALTREPVQVDATTKNKLVFTSGSTDDIRVLVIGTPA